MNCTTPTVDPAAILQAWMPFKFGSLAHTIFFCALVVAASVLG